MNERQKRLIEVYEHLRKYYGIHTKTASWAGRSLVPCRSSGTVSPSIPATSSRQAAG